jgi:O-acetyl-ADP-ribose deacetylase (regulator of RNase III)
LGGEAGGRAHVGEAVISKAIRERWAHVSHGPMAGLDFLHQGI